MDEIKSIKSIKIFLPIEKADYISEQAARQNISQRKYIETKLLDTTVGVQELKDKLLRGLPGYYALVQQVEDLQVRQALMDMGGTVCQFLR